MGQVNFTIVEPSQALRGDVECFRTATYTGSDGLEIVVCPSGLPGIAFQHNQHGQSAINELIGQAGPTSPAPTSFIYGQGTGLSTMHFLPGPYMTIQVVLKPQALSVLFGIQPATLNDSLVELQRYAGPDLPQRLLAASNNEARITLLSDFLLAKLAERRPRDIEVEHALRQIDETISAITIKSLIDQSGLSERHFERRFQDVVGLTPQFYLRVRRFTEATRLMKTDDYETLADVAHAVNFYDQSHFIRDMKEFSGITPRSLSQKVSDFHQDQGGASYL